MSNLNDDVCAKLMIPCQLYIKGFSYFGVGKICRILSLFMKGGVCSKLVITSLLYIKVFIYLFN